MIHSTLASVWILLVQHQFLFRSLLSVAHELSNCLYCFFISFIGNLEIRRWKKEFNYLSR